MTLDWFLSLFGAEQSAPSQPRRTEELPCLPIPMQRQSVDQMSEYMVSAARRASEKAAERAVDRAWEAREP